MYNDPYKNVDIKGKTNEKISKDNTKEEEVLFGSNQEAAWDYAEASKLEI